MSAPLRLSRDVVLGGDFRILAPLGAGGMGAVYTAEQLSTGKLRAVKVMNPLFVGDAKQRQRFAREARIGARVVSDHVVDVIAAGVDDELGMPWIAMELLEGDDLGEHVMRRGPQPPGRVLDVFRQLCHALGAAHQAGVVHRDVKPQNVFISTIQSAAGPTAVKVLDFGIAKVAAAASATGTAMVGSPAWMAPEQTDPQATITPAADVWALGLLAFWMLTGMSYWRAGNSAQASMHALMKEVLFDELTPASARAAEYERAERLPQGFDAWFARCVDREPAARFRDASDLYQAFEGLVGAVPGNQRSAQPAGELSVADVGVMSTRQVFDAEALAAGGGEAAVLSTRSFLESADLAVPVSRSGDVGPGATGPPVPGPTTSDLAQAGTLDASTATLAGQGAPPGRAGGRWPAAARHAVAALALIAVAAVALVVGMKLAGDREPRRAAPAEEETARERPAARGARSARSSARPRSSGPVATLPGMTPIPNADRFDVGAGFPEIEGLARNDAPDAKLVWFSAREVSDDGFTNLLGGGTASYMYRSAAEQRCFTATYTRMGRFYKEVPITQCPTTIVDHPNCSVAEAIARGKGGVELRGSVRCNVSFGVLRDKARTGWSVICGPFENNAVVDACE